MFPVATSKSETRVFPGPYDRVFRAVCDAARAEGMRVMSADPSIGQIYVTTSMTLMTVSYTHLTLPTKRIV